MLEVDKRELAEQIVINWAAGLAGYLGPGAGALAVGAAPLALAGLNHIASIIGSRRLEHDVETLLDGAEAFGADTPEEFVEFVEAAISDEEHQELLARALTIAQDTALRYKRRALGRALAAAASDTGTKVDTELEFIRVLDDLDASHIRCLRIIASNPPKHEEPKRRRPPALVVPEPPVDRWEYLSIRAADPGLADVLHRLLRVLELDGLIDRRGELGYVISGYGELFLRRLAEPE